MNSEATVRTSAGEAGPLEAQAESDFIAAEFLLTAACCRWPPSPSRDAVVRAAAARVRDWDGFLHLINRHRVAGLARAALSSAAVELPSTVAADLAKRSQNIARQNLRFAVETMRLQRTLDAAAIPVLVLKGVALAQLAYGSIDTKHARDIDLLVPADRAEAALQLLQRDGYELVAPARRLSERQRRSLVRYGREAELVHRDRKQRLELQWRAADNPHLLSGVDARTAAQSVTLAAGISVRTLATEDLFAYLCVHGARHGWSRLKWLADVNALICADAADIEGLYRHAQRLGAGLCAAQALLLCQAHLALGLPPALSDAMSRNRRTRKLLALALAALQARHADTEVDGGIAGVTRSVHTQFLLGQGFAFYAAQCRVASVGAADVIRWPLPAPLHGLYPLLRLPLWLWRRATVAFDRRRDG